MAGDRVRRGALRGDHVHLWRRRAAASAAAKPDGRAAAARRDHRRIRARVYVQRLALATQVALVIVLTVTGGLLLRSLDGAAQRRSRIQPARRDGDPRRSGRTSARAGARLPFFDRVLESVGAVPGVESAALTIHVPMGDRPSMGWDAIPQGREYNPVTDNAAGRIVSPGYFRTAGIRIVSGRDFDSRDVRPNPFVMAINETFARRIRAEGGDPLRARFLVLGNVRQVVAVVSDVKHRSLDADADARGLHPHGTGANLLPGRTTSSCAPTDPIALVPSIRDAIWAIDRNQALGTPVLLEEYIGRTLRPRRLLTEVIGVFAATALSARRVRRVRSGRLPRRPAHEGDRDSCRPRCAALARHRRRAE